MHVGAQVVNPQLLGPGRFRSRLLVEEQHICLYSLSVEQAGRQTQQGMHIALMQQLAADGLTRPAFEQHVIRHDHRSASILLEQCLHVLDEVELFVRGRRPEVAALDDVALTARLALLAHDGGAALLAERRIGEHQVEAVAGVGGERVGHHDGLELLAADAVQQHVHGAQPRRGLHQLPALEGFFLELLALILGHVRIMLHHIVMRCEQKAAGAAGRIAHGLAGLRRHDIDNGLDQRTRGEVLAGAGLGVLGILFQQAFVGIALHVGAHRHPVFLVDQIHDQPPQLGRVLELVLRLIEDQPEQALLVAQRLKRVAVVIEQLVTVFFDQTRPVVAFRYRAFLVVRRLGALVGHLEKQQISELLDVVAIRHAVVAQDVAVIPEFLDDG